MDLSDIFTPESRQLPFESYEQYTGYLFACVDRQLGAYIRGMMELFAAENGGYKNVLYPDIEIAYNLCEKHMADFTAASSFQTAEEEGSEEAESLPDDLKDLFASFGEETVHPEEVLPDVNPEELLDYVRARAELTDKSAVPMPFHTLCSRLELSNFSTFCFACAVLSSTQTNYASIFQVANQNGSLSAPSVESAARIYYGKNFTITGAYGEMSLALEQLAPIFDLRINSAMPFTTLVSPDKRLIDFLFGKHPMRIDENYKRFFTVLTPEGELEPFIANKSQLEALHIS
jgi:hypothetical protein